MTATRIVTPAGEILVMTGCGRVLELEGSTCRLGLTALGGS